jgi:septum formation protein
VTRLVLASGSPARLATLLAAGVRPEVVVSGVDEEDVTGTPEHVALELARRKARAVAAEVGDGEAVVLGCDSVLDLGGRTLGKPIDAADAVRRWGEMRGATGVLRTGHCVVRGDSEASAVAATTVRFGTPTDAEVEAYVATGEPLRVAGAFTIDGLGGWFVDGVDGDPANVVGLSLPLLRRLLADVGVAVTDLWSAVPREPGTAPR